MPIRKKIEKSDDGRSWADQLFPILHYMEFLVRLDRIKLLPLSMFIRIRTS